MLNKKTKNLIIVNFPEAKYSKEHDIIGLNPHKDGRLIFTMED